VRRLYGVALGEIRIRRSALFVSPEHLILNFFRLKVNVKVDLLKLRLKLVFPHNYFQILRQKHSTSFYLENIKVRPGDDFSTACLPG
jgi:hypothetical protein